MSKIPFVTTTFSFDNVVHCTNSERIDKLCLFCRIEDSFPAKAKLVLSSEKLVQEGFHFKYGIEEIYDETVEYFKNVGLQIGNMS